MSFSPPNKRAVIGLVLACLTTGKLCFGAAGDCGAAITQDGTNFGKTGNSKDTHEAKATKHFQEYLAKCGTNEIRCVWFLQDRPDTGMVMTMNLEDYSVYTVREVYDWALQNSETRKLTHSQVLSLQQISSKMPPSDPAVDLVKAVSVSIRRGDKVEVFLYNRQRAPTVIQRIYDIGGGYFYDGKDG